MWRVSLTNWLLSKKPTSFTPEGSSPWISPTLAFTRSVTVRLFSPISMTAMAATASPLPSLVMVPCRIAGPNLTSATSFTKTGAPLSANSTISRMSSSDSTQPTPCTNCCSSSFRM